MLRLTTQRGLTMLLIAFVSGGTGAQSNLSCVDGRVSGLLQHQNLSAALSELAHCVGAEIEIEGLRRDRAVNITLHDSAFEQAVARLARDSNYILRKTRDARGALYVLSFPAPVTGAAAPIPESALPQPSPPNAPLAPSPDENEEASADDMAQLTQIALGGDDVGSRLEAIEQLAQQGGDAIEGVLRQLAEDPDEEVRELAMELLEQFE